MKSRRWRAGARRYKGRGLTAARSFDDRERERWYQFVKPQREEERGRVTREMALDAGDPSLEGSIW